MRLTERQLNRATLARQLLLARARIGPVEALRRVVALQAQEPPSPYVALWNRIEAFDPAALDRAFACGEVVKASLMRITLHAVEASDYPAFHDAMSPTLRASRLNDRRFRAAGLTIPEVDSLVPDLLEFTREPRTGPEIERWLAGRLPGRGETSAHAAWWALKTFAPLTHAPSGTPWSFGLRPVYVDGRKETRNGDDLAAIGSLVRRYLEGFGPASKRDLSQFALIPGARLGPALESLAGALVRFDGPGGEALFDVPGGPIPDETTFAAPRLLGMWESSLLAYADRSRVLPEPYRRAIIRVNGDVLPAILVDGYVAGVWRPLDGAIELRAFHALRPEAWDGLAAEALALLPLLQSRGPWIYRRYFHWWPSLAEGEIRTVRAL